LSSISPNAVKVACAIGVAAKIFVDTVKNPNSPNKFKKSQIAADAIDRTVALPSLYAIYQSKPAGVPVAVFLLEHLDLIGLQTPDCWPANRVKPRDRGEYGQVMAGLDAFLASKNNDFSENKEIVRNVLCMLDFLESLWPVYSPELVAGMQSLKASLV